MAEGSNAPPVVEDESPTSEPTGRSSVRSDREPALDPLRRSQIESLAAQLGIPASDRGALTSEGQTIRHRLMTEAARILSKEQSSVTKAHRLTQLAVEIARQLADHTVDRRFGGRLSGLRKALTRPGGRLVAGLASVATSVFAPVSLLAPGLWVEGWRMAAGGVKDWWTEQGDYRTALTHATTEFGCSIEQRLTADLLRADPAESVAERTLADVVDDVYQREFAALMKKLQQPKTAPKHTLTALPRWGSRIFALLALSPMDFDWFRGAGSSFTEHGRSHVVSIFDGLMKGTPFEHFARNPLLESGRAWGTTGLNTLSQAGQLGTVLANVAGGLAVGFGAEKLDEWLQGDAVQFDSSWGPLRTRAVRTPTPVTSELATSVSGRERIQTTGAFPPPIYPTPEPFGWRLVGASGSSVDTLARPAATATERIPITPTTAAAADDDSRADRPAEPSSPAITPPPTRPAEPRIDVDDRSTEPAGRVAERVTEEPESARDLATTWLDAFNDLHREATRMTIEQLDARLRQLLARQLPGDKKPWSRITKTPDRSRDPTKREAYAQIAREGLVLTRERLSRARRADKTLGDRGKAIGEQARIYQIMVGELLETTPGLDQSELREVLADAILERGLYDVHFEESSTVGSESMPAAGELFETGGEPPAPPLDVAPPISEPAEIVPPPPTGTGSATLSAAEGVLLPLPPPRPKRPESSAPTPPTGAADDSGHATSGATPTPATSEPGLPKHYAPIPFDEPTGLENLLIQALEMEVNGVITDGPTVATELSLFLGNLETNPPDQTAVAAILRRISVERTEADSGESTVGGDDLLTIVSAPVATFRQALIEIYQLDRTGAHERRFLKQCLERIDQLGTKLALMPKLTDDDRARLAKLSQLVRERQSILDGQIARAYQSNPWTTAGKPSGTMESA